MATQHTCMTDSVTCSNGYANMQPQSHVHYNHQPRQFQSPFAFQKNLKKIDDGLGSKDVEKLCFLCRDFEDLPWKEVQDFKRGLELFSALQKVDLLSSGDVSVLFELLEAIQRRDLLKKARGIWPDTVPSKQITPYRKLLLDIANNTVSTDLADMKAMACLPYAADDIKNTIQFMIAMETSGMLDRDNLNNLMEITPNKMNIKKISKYLASPRPPQPSPQTPSDAYTIGDLKPPAYFTMPPSYVPSTTHTAEDDVTQMSSAIGDLRVTEKEEEEETEKEEQKEAGTTDETHNPHENLTVLMESSSKKADGIDRQKSTFDTTNTMISMTLPADSLEHTGVENIPVRSDGTINQGVLGGDYNLVGTAKIHQDEPDSTIQRDLRRCYRMDAKPRGFCLIINNDTFYKGDGVNKKLKERRGSEKDVEKLLNCFHKFNFEVIKHDNLTSEEMYNLLQDIRKSPELEKHNAFVCCILTHGKLGQLAGSNSKYLLIRDVISIFSAEKCRHLAGKPKLFFLQACQGTDEQGLTDIEQDCARPPKRPGIGSGLQETIPNEADFLLGYATVPGYVSYRSRTEGSWYINKLVDTLIENYKKEDLMSMLTIVNQKLSQAKAERKDGDMGQVPAPVMSLTKKVYFHRHEMVEYIIHQ